MEKFSLIKSILSAFRKYIVLYVPMNVSFVVGPFIPPYYFCVSHLEFRSILNFGPYWIVGTISVILNLFH